MKVLFLWSVYCEWLYIRGLFIDFGSERIKFKFKC